jgi:polyisoprenoid-binding protein YceI
MTSRRARRWALWLVSAVVAAVVAVLGSTFVYIHFISGKAPAPLSLKATAGARQSTSPAGDSAAAAPLAGRWKAGSGSVVGYRVQEVLFGQKNIAVGRTSAITGSITIRGTNVTTGTFTVQMATIKSNESQRDVQFNGRIMDTSAYPTGMLALTRPIKLAPLPALGTVKTYSASANLTLHGQTRPVIFTLSAERATSGIEISGSIPVLFSNWDIPNPSFGNVITTQNHGELEFLLKFQRS